MGGWSKKKQYDVTWTPLLHREEIALAMTKTAKKKAPKAKAKAKAKPKAKAATKAKAKAKPKAKAKAKARRRPKRRRSNLARSLVDGSGAGRKFCTTASFLPPPILSPPLMVASARSSRPSRLVLFCFPPPPAPFSSRMPCSIVRWRRHCVLVGETQTSRT